MIPNDPNSQRGPGDEDLRDLFSILRQQDSSHIPRFIAEPKTRRGNPPLRFGWRVTAACAFTATLLAAFLWLRDQRHLAAPAHASGTSDASITEWRPGTDFLLNTPGREFLRTTRVLNPVILPPPYRQRPGSPPNRKSNSKSTPPRSLRSSESPAPLSR